MGTIRVGDRVKPKPGLFCNKSAGIKPTDRRGTVTGCFGNVLFSVRWDYIGTSDRLHENWLEKIDAIEPGVL